MKVPFAQIKKGFQGFPGWRYHPTKGFRKESSFKPLSAKELSDIAAKKAGIA